MVCAAVFRSSCGLLLGIASLLPVLAAEETQVTLATFNIEWLGYPWNSGEWYGSRDAQIRAAVQEILAVDADIFALQEVIVDSRNGNALEDLLSQLNALDDGESWEGMHNQKFSFWWNPDFEDYPAQRQAYIWKSSTVKYKGASILLNWLPAGDDRFGSGRLPLLLKVEVGEGEVRFPLHLVNLHLKCCRGSDDRRRRSMTTLVNELQASYAEIPMVVLGDFNVADDGGAYGEIADWGFYEDDDGDGGPDFFHAAGAVADLSWDDIDHIMMSDELEVAYERVPAAMRNVIVDSDVSDHGPVVSSLIFQPTNAQLYEVWSGDAFNGNPLFDGKTAYGDDPDGDSMANYLEFALGGNPTVADAGEVGPRIRFDDSGNVLVSCLVRNTLPEDSIHLLTTTGLQDWSGWEPGPAEGTVEPGVAPEFDRFTLTIPGLRLDRQWFFRLEVDTPAKSVN
jgi:endonuclease/exonuclease/phosphatase family metal-dependent hydrolase